MNKIDKSLLNFCERCENAIWEKGKACPFRSISNDYCEDIEKANERIDALKKQKKDLVFDKDMKIYDRYLLFYVEKLEDIEQDFDEVPECYEEIESQIGRSYFYEKLKDLADIIFTENKGYYLVYFYDVEKKQYHGLQFYLNKNTYYSLNWLLRKKQQKEEICK